jgi:hypothetical protein
MAPVIERELLTAGRRRRQAERSYALSTRHQPNALVPVDERVVLHDVEQVGRSHCEQPIVHESAVERGLRLSHCGLEHAPVAHAISPAIAPELQCVQVEYVIDVQDR